MYKLFQVMRMEENVCITTYFNAFENKMAYILRDKDPKTLRDAFKIAVNIENNRRASGKLAKRDDPTLFNPGHNKRDGNKPATNKKSEEDKMDQVIGLLKNLNPQGLNNRNENNINDRSQYANNFNWQNQLKFFPYNRNWKDGQPNVPPLITTTKR